MTEHEHTDIPAEKRLAPGDLRHVQDLVNTRELGVLDAGEEHLGDAAALSAWLAERGLAEPGSRFSAADVRRMHAVREGLRALALTHNGGEADPAALAALQHEASRAPLEVRFGTSPELVPAREGIGGVVGRLLAIVAQAESDGTWQRFKACGADDCQWAFYDHSRNRSRAWCSMEVCGNRAKARAYRERERRGG